MKVRDIIINFIEVAIKMKYSSIEDLKWYYSIEIYEGVLISCYNKWIKLFKY